MACLSRLNKKILVWACVCVCVLIPLYFVCTVYLCVRGGSVCTLTHAFVNMCMRVSVNLCVEHLCAN